MNTLTDKEKVWERLKHVSKPVFVANYDVNSLYPFQVDTILGIEKIKGDAESVTIKVFKNRR